MVSPEIGSHPANPESVAADRQAAVEVSFFSAVARERDIAFNATEGVVQNVREEKAFDAGVSAVLKTLDQLKATVHFKHSETDHQTSGPFVDDYFAHINS